MLEAKQTRTRSLSNSEEKDADSLDPDVESHFRDGTLNIRGYRFRNTLAWGDPRSACLLAEGVKVDGRTETRVAAKVIEGGPELEKEAYINKLLSGSLEGGARVFRLIEVIKIPPSNGNVQILVFRHPGDNILAQYMSASERQSSFLPGSKDDRQRASDEGSSSELQVLDGLPDAPSAAPANHATHLNGRSIDLASFLHFALQAVQCLELLHAKYGPHGDIRPSAFHWSKSDDLVRFAHFRGRTIHLDNFGSTASLILEAQNMTSEEQEAVKDMICYIPPECAANILGGANHLSDLYGLGTTFWRLLSGRRMFSGNLRTIINAVITREPPTLHSIRPDIPSVISKMVGKLLSKTPDDRYASASGLKEDLVECARNLGQGWTSEMGTVELIRDFSLGRSDHYSVFHIHDELFGREQESKLIQHGIHEFTTRYTRRQHAFGLHYGVGSSSGLNSDLLHHDDQQSSTASIASAPRSITYSSRRDHNDDIGLRMIVVQGSAGSGKSSLLWRECSREVPSTALAGQAKFDSGNPTPYSAILKCLCSVFRQLLTFSQIEMFAFGDALRDRLGPQCDNVSLLFPVVPEFEQLAKTVWPDIIDTNMANNSLGTAESRIRFENLLTNILAELAATKMVTFFLDDLHNADAPSLAMIEAFARARVNILILSTIRSSYSSITERLRHSLGSNMNIITLRPLTASATSGLACRTLHVGSDEAAPLVTALVRHSRGNAFTVRSLLLLLKSENYLVFNFNSNQWTYEPKAVQDFLDSRSRIDPDNVDANFLLQHIRDLPVGTQQVLAVAAAIGPVFDARLVYAFIEDHSIGVEEGGGPIEQRISSSKMVTHSWVLGLQNAIVEGMIVARGNDQHAFTHDRYREASLAIASLHFGGLPKISAKLVEMMLNESDNQDHYKISDQILRALPVLGEKAQRSPYAHVLASAGSQAFSQGAPESALIYYDAAHKLMGHERDTSTLLKLSELLTWKGDVAGSEALLSVLKELTPDEKVYMLQTRSRNLFNKQQVAAAQDLLLEGLRELGVDLRSSYTQDEVDKRHHITRARMLEVGMDHMRNLPSDSDPDSNLRNALLSEVFIFAYFQDQLVARMIAYEGISLALRDGLSAHNVMALICFASAAVGQGDFKFGAQVGRFALDLSLRLSTTLDKGRVHIYFSALIAPSDSEHFMQTWALSQKGLNLARAGGDSMFAGFGQTHLMVNRFFTFQVVDDVIAYADVAIGDLPSFGNESAPVFLILSMQRVLKAIAGQTWSQSCSSILDTDDWDHNAYLATIKASTPTWDSWYNWHESYRICALYNLGYHAACLEAGKYAAQTAHYHPGHRHNHLALFYVGLAACQMAREEKDNVEYIELAAKNLLELGKYLEPAGINIAHWYYLLAAEISSVQNDRDSILLYDKAISAAERGQWALESAWALYLVGAHFERIGAVAMASSFQRQALSRFALMGAHGVIRQLAGVDEGKRPTPPHIVEYFDVGVQAEPMSDMTSGDLCVDQIGSYSSTAARLGVEDQGVRTTEESLERVIQHLSSKDLAALIYALQAITTDVNLSTSLERLTDLMMSSTAASARQACIVSRHEESGDFHLYTTQQLGEPVNILNPTISLEAEAESPRDGIIIPIIQQVLRSGKPLSLPRISSDPRFRPHCVGAAAEFNSVLVLPIRSKGITQGALYLASHRAHAFSEGDMLVLNLMAMQAAVLISNGLLFASLRKSTQANLRAISEQRIALEAARRSQEEAIHATRVKSIFLANMSHEMRTPFAAFYGVLGLLSETDLSEEQGELVDTAKLSCELLLETISALLDFSKLEAHAAKLSVAPLSLTKLLVDCQELLMTLASDKQLDLTYSVDEDVPVVEGDTARLRQILQNLIGNAMKFTLKGSVDVSISVDRSDEIVAESDQVCIIKLEVSDTGIGLSKADIARLFTPFSQVDSSSTRSFGGTGLGLSICRELITLMGGTISVTGQDGVGSCFKCLIPLRICEIVPEPLAAAEEAVRSLRTSITTTAQAVIWIYSSSASTRRMINRCLKGMKVHTADSLDQLKMELSSLANRASDTEIEYPTVVVVDGMQDAIDTVIGTMNTVPALRRTRVIQLIARSMTTMHRVSKALPPSEATSSTPAPPPSQHVVRCSKPLRAVAFLRCIAEVHASHLTLEPTSEVPLDASATSTPTPTPTTTTTTTSTSSGSDPTPKPSTVPSSIPQASSAPSKTSSFFTEAQLETFKSTRFLIAEDNVVAQRLLVRQLKNLGFVVTASSNGLEAVDHWLAQPPGYFKVALFDHHMPLSDGLSAARRIRALEKEKNVEEAIPIISLTADAHTQAMEDCLKAGMQMYLTKPLRQDDLIKLIRQFVLDDTTPHT